MTLRSHPEADDSLWQTLNGSLPFETDAMATRGLPHCWTPDQVKMILDAMPAGQPWLLALALSASPGRSPQPGLARSAIRRHPAVRHGPERKGWPVSRGAGPPLEVWPESHWPGFALRQADV